MRRTSLEVADTAVHGERIRWGGAAKNRADAPNLPPTLDPPQRSLEPRVRGGCGDTIQCASSGAKGMFVMTAYLSLASLNIRSGAPPCAPQPAPQRLEPWPCSSRARAIGRQAQAGERCYGTTACLADRRATHKKLLEDKLCLLRLGQRGRPARRGPRCWQSPPQMRMAAP